MRMPPAPEGSVRPASACARVAVILGSGFGDLIGLIQNAQMTPGADIPGYPSARTRGHQGQLVTGTLAGRDVVVIQGRSHLYEGWASREATFPVRLVRKMGARSVVITCGAGGIGLAPGTLLFLTDYLRLGPTPSLGRSGHVVPYDTGWIRRAQQAAMMHGIDTRRGKIAWTLGPNYETKAEIRYFRGHGASAVGMSTIPEVLEARHLGMSVLGLALITNAASGLSSSALSHEEVLACGRQMTSVLKQLIPEIVRLAP